MQLKPATALPLATLLVASIAILSAMYAWWPVMQAQSQSGQPAVVLPYINQSQALTPIKLPGAYLLTASDSATVNDTRLDARLKPNQYQLYLVQLPTQSPGFLTRYSVIRQLSPRTWLIRAQPSSLSELIRYYQPLLVSYYHPEYKISPMAMSLYRLQGRQLARLKIELDPAYSPSTVWQTVLQLDEDITAEEIDDSNYTIVFSAPARAILPLARLNSVIAIYPAD